MNMQHLNIHPVQLYVASFIQIKLHETSYHGRRMVVRARIFCVLAPSTLFSAAKLFAAIEL